MSREAGWLSDDPHHQRKGQDGDNHVSSAKEGSTSRDWAPKISACLPAWLMTELGIENQGTGAAIVRDMQDSLRRGGH